MSTRSFFKQLGLAGTALATVIFTATQVRPVYAGRTPVVSRLVHDAWRDSAEITDSLAVRAPWAVAPFFEALGTPSFQADRRAFALDLVRTGQVDSARADSLATFAVREAYERRVPPALVFGVLMVESPTLKSKARSNVGAIGLMQVHGVAWRPTLGGMFGRNLSNDETNFRYGVYILSHNLYDAAQDLETTDPDTFVRRGLLRYNGCVRGTNTRNCHRYPDMVRRKVETLAIAQCGLSGYKSCVAEPLRLSLRGE